MHRLSLLGIAGALLFGVSTTLAATPTPAPTPRATPAPTPKATPAPTPKATPAPTPKATPAPTAKPGWEAFAGLYKTKALAAHQISVMAKKGFTGYRTELEKSKLYEVSKEFATQKLATAEVARLHKAKFRASVESSPGKM